MTGARGCFQMGHSPGCQCEHGGEVERPPRLLDWLWAANGNVACYVEFQNGAREWVSWPYAQARDTFGAVVFR